jgi:hypothetical protein
MLLLMKMRWRAILVQFSVGLFLGIVGLFLLLMIIDILVDNSGFMPHGFSDSVFARVLPVGGPLCAIAFAWMEWKKQYRKRLHRHVCQSCGYDLRATPDRCPECGTIPPKKLI